MYVLFLLKNYCFSENQIWPFKCLFFFFLSFTLLVSFCLEVDDFICIFPWLGFLFSYFIFAENFSSNLFHEKYVKNYSDLMCASISNQKQQVQFIANVLWIKSNEKKFSRRYLSKHKEILSICNIFLCS